MTLPLQPADWGDSMAPPRVWGAWLLEWLENTPPTSRDDNDMALRAITDAMGDMQQVVDQLEVWQRQHDAAMPRAARKVGDTAMETADALERRRETLELEDAIDEQREAEYRRRLEAPPGHGEDQPRGDRDLPGYDPRMFGRDELDDTRRR